MSSAGVAALSKCSFLHTLNADCSEIGDTDLQLICTALPSLTSLNFFSARITDAGVCIILAVTELSPSSLVFV